MIGWQSRIGLEGYMTGDGMPSCVVMNEEQYKQHIRAVQNAQIDVRQMVAARIVQANTEKLGIALSPNLPDIVVPSGLTDLSPMLANMFRDFYADNKEQLLLLEDG